ncbi:MAG: hypothetical protein JJ892_07155 [Balneola sp.]|nr:hypothetical protein [Balneola sp.]MBO6650908.1 hypothetical protein [Balneola sp.]MBO6711850.1 hypothetical protein [Balneola sp.]MBO6800045.1 hypothetical protein [Balneola sp.]MBO6871574.1 hypothetical protein [Balneola sp.]
MKISIQNKNLVFSVLSGLLVMIAISGVLEESSVKYVKGIAEKNLGFLGLLTELKLLVSGISDFVPFLKEHNQTFNESLGKAEHYLLIANVISLTQLMLLEVSKTWFVKGLVILLFGLTFLPKLKSLPKKLFIVVLAVCPGLQLFSVSMHQLSKPTTIDYGEKYLTELNASVDSLQSERAQLMQEHENNMTEIDNGKKGIRLFKKLKEDISYDLKKSAATIKGDYSQIRILLHSGGKEILRKLSIFGTMVFFSLFIMPIGYSIVVYIIYKSVITAEVKEELESIEKKLQTRFIDMPASKIKSTFEKVEKKEEAIKSDIKDAENRVQQEENSIKKNIESAEEDIKDIKNLRKKD